MNQPTFGQIAYEAFKTEAYLPWELINPEIQQRWEHSARAVVYAFIKYDGARV